MIELFFRWQREIEALKISSIVILIFAFYIIIIIIFSFKGKRKAEYENKAKNNFKTKIPKTYNEIVLNPYFNLGQKPSSKSFFASLGKKIRNFIRIINL